VENVTVADSFRRRRWFPGALVRGWASRTAL